MVDFERNDHDFIRQTVRDMIQNPRVGEVLQVYEHTLDDDDSNFELDVAFPEEEDTLEHRVIPLQNPGADSIDVPRVGDRVIVEYLHGDKKNPVVRNSMDTNKDRAVKANAGMRRNKYLSAPEKETPTKTGDLYFTGFTRFDEAPIEVGKDYRDLEPQEAFFRFSKKVDATDQPENIDVPMNFEMRDTLEDDKSHFLMEGNIVDKDESLGFTDKMDLKEGTLESIAENENTGVTTTISQDVKNDVMNFIADDGSQQYTIDFEPSVPSITIQSTSGELGLKLNFDTGKFKILDSDGYGIVSGEDGAFRWHRTDLDITNSTTTL